MRRPQSSHHLGGRIGPPVFHPTQTARAPRPPPPAWGTPEEYPGVPHLWGWGILPGTSTPRTTRASLPEDPHGMPQGHKGSPNRAPGGDPKDPHNRSSQSNPKSSPEGAPGTSQGPTTSLRAPPSRDASAFWDCTARSSPSCAAPACATAVGTWAAVAASPCGRMNPGATPNRGFPSPEERLFYFASFCFTLLYFALLYFALLYVALPCFTLRCFASLRFALLCFVLLCFVLLYFALLCFTLLYFALLRFTLL